MNTISKITFACASTEVMSLRMQGGEQQGAPDMQSASNWLAHYMHSTGLHDDPEMGDIGLNMCQEVRDMLKNTNKNVDKKKKLRKEFEKSVKTFFEGIDQKKLGIYHNSWQRDNFTECMLRNWDAVDHSDDIADVCEYKKQRLESLKEVPGEIYKGAWKRWMKAFSSESYFNMASTKSMEVFTKLIFLDVGLVTFASFSKHGSGRGADVSKDEMEKKMDRLEEWLDRLEERLQELRDLEEERLEKLEVQRRNEAAKQLSLEKVVETGDIEGLKCLLHPDVDESWTNMERIGIWDGKTYNTRLPDFYKGHFDKKNFAEYLENHGKDFFQYFGTHFGYMYVWPKPETENIEETQEVVEQEPVIEQEKDEQQEEVVEQEPVIEVEDEQEEEEQEDENVSSCENEPARRKVKVFGDVTLKQKETRVVQRKQTPKKTEKTLRKKEKTLKKKTQTRKCRCCRKYCPCC